jgi:hypothetical protein
MIVSLRKHAWRDGLCALRSGQCKESSRQLSTAFLMEESGICFCFLADGLWETSNSTVAFFHAVDID